MPDLQQMLNSGATARQIDTWTTAGHLRALTSSPGTGVAREWLRGEDDTAAMIVRLTRAGLTLAAAVKVARGQSQIAPGVWVMVLDTAPTAVPA